MKPVVTHGDYEAAQAQWILSVVLEGTPKIRRRALFFQTKKVRQVVPKALKVVCLL